MSVSIIDTIFVAARFEIRYKRSMEPAKHIISALGGPSEVSRITGAHRTRVSNWMRRKEDGGTGGIIPFKHAPALLSAAKERGVPLSADDFLPKVEAVQ